MGGNKEGLRDEEMERWIKGGKEEERMGENETGTDGTGTAICVFLFGSLIDLFVALSSLFGRSISPLVNCLFVRLPGWLLSWLFDWLVV